ncbi:MAG: LLM class F420-dependent oxidoreductase, partial [Armatimonadetes bacterium]|nr:LLM class F420-dependent oxidoreductase [Armatimonadota bacterium]
QVARAAGRDPDAIGIEGRVSMVRSTPEDWRKAAAEWRALGATHLSVNTMGAGFASPAAHIDAIRRFKEAVVG